MTPMLKYLNLYDNQIKQFLRNPPTTCGENQMSQRIAWQGRQKKKLLSLEKTVCENVKIETEYMYFREVNSSRDHVNP